MSEMTALEAAALYDRLSKNLTEWAKSMLGKASVQIGARAVTTFIRKGPSGPVHPTKLTSRSSRLARSLTGGRAAGTLASEAISEIKVLTDMIVQLIKGSKVPHARAHELGLRKVQYVRPHKRISKLGIRHNVRGHARKMMLAKRAFLQPAVQRELPKLQKMAKKDLRVFLEKALTV